MTVPIHLEGEPDSVRVEGGVLVQALHELQVEAFRRTSRITSRLTLAGWNSTAHRFTCAK
jgi:hypothetical protein